MSDERYDPEREAVPGRMVAVSRLLHDESSWEWLDLPTPAGGTSYWHDTAAETADNLERLRDFGLNVPQSAIDALRDEATTPSEESNDE